MRRKAAGCRDHGEPAAFSYMGNMKPLGIYIHIPFCVRRCPYCGFYSNAVGTRGCGGAADFRPAGSADLMTAGSASDRDAEVYDPEISEYFDMVMRELELRRKELGSSYYVDSVYFGGGTPSLAAPDLIGGAVDGIRTLFGVSDDCEVSMEANPGTLGTGDGGVERLAAYRDAGVNRLSIGAQSFDDGVLGTLGRIHSADDARQACRDARAAGFSNVSMDLMFGVPGQTMEVWESTVEEAASMLPDHVSFYSLQIEEGTSFYQEYKMGEMVPVTDEEDRAMYHAALEILRGHGYRQYEISNAALLGKECRHNLKYWTFCDYLGVGASASSFISGRRRTDPGAGYMQFGASGFPDSGLSEDHRNSGLDNAADYMITGLRLACGIDEEDFSARFGKTVWEMFPDARDELENFFLYGLIVEESGRLYITEQGFDVSNRMLESFV